MDGLIIVNKPAGLTSHDVCEILKKQLNTKKVGHTGTLDPMATGVLVVAVNKATKLIQYLENQEKTYRAEALLGVETDTYDVLGKVLQENRCFNIDENKIIDVLGELKEQKEQIPPIYSAIKVKGKKLYQYALNNEDVEIKARPINIKRLELEKLSKLEDKYYVQFLVKANKGFYVRSLIHDLGMKLNTFATMSKLTRIQAGNFALNQSQTLAEIKEFGAKIISIEEVFNNSAKIEVSDYLAKLVKNGIEFDERQFTGDELFRVYNQNKLIAIYAPCGVNKYKPIVYLGG